MSQRDSGYKRKARDNYTTPEWVTEALLPHIRDNVIVVWEPACGSGKMVKVLKRRFMKVIATDIEKDFLTSRPPKNFDAIITNPPYVHAVEFIFKAINFTEPRRGYVAMLLRTDFDHAKTRADLFGGCPMFAKKIILTRRIKWIEKSKGSPSFNHAWFIWDWRHKGLPTLAYDQPDNSCLTLPQDQPDGPPLQWASPS